MATPQRVVAQVMNIGDYADVQTLASQLGDEAFRESLRHAEAKDYRDIVAMIRAGVSLARGLAGARLSFGTTFQPSESLKALVYFKDGDLSELTLEEKRVLVDAAIAVRDLPDVKVLSQRLVAE